MVTTDSSSFLPVGNEETIFVPEMTIVEFTSVDGGGLYEVS